MAKEMASNRTYLIRCWQVINETGLVWVWRFSIEEVLLERKRWGFNDLDTLLAFLREEFSGNTKPVSTVE